MKESASVPSSTPEFRSSITKSYPDSNNAQLTLRNDSALTKLIVKAGAETAAASQIGVPFGTSRSVGDVLVVGQRPDEWMIVGPSDASWAYIEGLDRTGHVSVIDHTHSRDMFRITGEQATSMLEKVCGIDWSDPMTPNGAATSASVALTTCDIIRNDVRADPAGRSYLLAMDRSFGQYLFDALVDAAGEFHGGVVSS